ncbi:exodeoxyribonuclease VII large subunit [Roseivirga sp. 4D4]|uniref:exodeoxyribonuclease VII large subunit n=1 Tax=Roseivirga sp. 4D4 TaxID=1889784 RepID=UPI0008531A27|nr:exodeoxyribonuclease VII large subunit [Roseivirga sp. 4D4]OEK01668.1 exodeoxyribonuclease VII large subunit [Roseivirga sp. 4D4]
MAQLTLFELNNLIKTQLEANLDPSYWVVAEISELRVNQKGHCYLELVEKENNFIQAKMRANIWSYTYRTLSAQFEQTTGTPLKAGIKVLFNLTINFHEVYGLSLTVNDIDPNYTIGERSRLREQTIKRLESEDLLNKNKSLALPIVPQKVAVISSNTAAGYGDFIEQLNNNSDNYSFYTQLFPALMQGNEAVISIRKALKEIHESKTSFDATIIIRGGGAQADLDCFDTYELARAIALFPLPILTGIGHERDQTVADLVAHTSLKTPTAVAEFLITGMSHFDNLLYDYLYRIEKEYKTRLNTEQQKLHYLSSRIDHSAKEILQSHDHGLAQKALSLKHLSERHLEREKSLINRLDQQLTLINPSTILSKGYSLTLKNGKSVMTQKIEIGDILEIRAANKTINSQVTKVENE